MFTREHAVKRGVNVLVRKKMIACGGNAVELSGIPGEIKILPIGSVKSQKGDFIVDDESADLIINEFKERRLDLVIDYEHQTLSDVQAPAGGWIKDIRKGEDALIADVEWTDRAKEYLEHKEYKYLSPVVIVRIKDSKAVAIHSVALTNTPAIDGMFPIVNSIDIEQYENENKKGANQMLEQLIKMLNLPEDSTEEDVIKAVEELGNKTEEKTDPEQDGKEKCETVANSTILGLLELPEGAKTNEVVSKIMTLKAGDANIMQKVLQMEKEMQKREADALVKTALKEGKISPAQKEWAATYALKDGNGFKKFMDGAPQVVPVGKIDYSSEEKEIKVDEVDMKALKNMGLSEEDIKKYVLKGDENK